MTNQRNETSRPRLRRWLYPTWNERKEAIRRARWLLAGGAYALLLFAYLFPQDFRQTGVTYVWVAWTAFMIRTFLFHFGVFLLLVLAVAAVLRVWTFMLALVPVLIFTLGPAIWKLIPVTPSDRVDIVVMTVNLFAANGMKEAIVDEIQGARPDILLLQEYTFDRHDVLLVHLGDSYSFRAFVRRNDSFGAAIYSKLAFAQPAELQLPLGGQTVPQIRAVVRLGERKLALYNIHLLPPVSHDYIVETRAQFADLLGLLANESLMTIVGGDFNYTERSPQVLALFRAGFRDAHAEAGWGRGTTWPNLPSLSWLPAVKIDHLFLRGLNATACRTGLGQGSDHRPVIAGFTTGPYARCGEGR